MSDSRSCSSLTKLQQNFWSLCTLVCMCLFIKASLGPLYAQGAKHPSSVEITQAQRSAHGTVNILLANKNGLVAITDSRLSSGGQTLPYLGQKMFKLDSETICTIAGFYFAFGPQMADEAGKELYPAFTMTSDIIKHYLAVPQRANGLTMQRKVDSLTSIVSFALEVSANANSEIPLEKIAPSPIALTVAGFEGGAIKVMQVRLDPKLKNGMWSYTKSIQPAAGICKRDFVVATSFACSMAGLTDPAEKILEGHDQTVADEPSVKKFLKAKAEGTTDLLTIDDLQALGEVLKRRSSDPPRDKVVGGPTQIAVLSNEQISKWEQPVLPLTGPERYKFNIVKNAEFHGQGAGSPQGYLYVMDKKMIVIEMGAVIENTSQPLDNVIFQASVLRDCLLTYNGSQFSMLSPSNKIIHSELRVAPEVNMQSNNFLNQVRKNFPDLTITQGLVRNPSSWVIGMGSSD